MSPATKRLPMQPLSWKQWKLVLLLSTINFVHILDFVIVMPLGDQLREELSISPAQFGNVVSAYGIAAMIAGVLAALVSDRLNRRHVMLVMLAGFTLGTLYCGVAKGYHHLILARALAGGCGGVIASTIMSFVVELIPDDRRGRAIGVVTSSFAFASTIGLPIGLTLANLFERFGAPFLAIAGLSVLMSIVCFELLPNLPGRTSQQDRFAHRQFLYVVTQPNHLWSFLFMLMMVMGTFMIVPFIAPYLEANCGLSRQNLPLIYLVGGIFTLVSMNFIGWLTDRFGARPVFIVGASSALVLTLIITNLPPVSLAIAILTTTAFMCAASCRVVPAQAMMLRSADPSARGAFTSLNTAVSHLATGIAPAISGALMGEEYKNGPLTGYWLVGLLAVCFGSTAIGLSFFLRPALESPSKSVLKSSEDLKTPFDSLPVEEEAELATVCGDPVS
jgi:predicted MFS family arabinose efflux permease